jgi:nitroreductase
MEVISHVSNHVKHAPAVEGVLPAFHRRWSARSFSERAVTSGDLKTIFEAVRWSPSAFNEQPWRFVVGEAGTETHAQLAATLMGFNKAWAHKAPVLILGVAKSTFSHNGASNPYALYELGAATAAMVLQAADMGLTAHQLAGFDHEAARKSLGIPDDFAIGILTALGYPGEPDRLGDETLIARETAPRSRKDIGEIALSAWNEPAKIV